MTEILTPPSRRRKLHYDTEHDDVVTPEKLKTPSGEYEITTITTAGIAETDRVRKPNEDAFSVVLEGDIINLALFDGASSQKPITGLHEIGITGARYASHTLKELFEESRDLADPAATLKGINAELKRELSKFASVDYDDKNSLPTSTATLVRIDPETETIKVGHVGDSFAMVLYDDGTTELITNDLHRIHDDKVKDLLVEVAEELGVTPRQAKSDPRIKAATMAMFERTRNVEDGSGEGMANGDPNMDQYVYAPTYSLKRVWAVIIGSDGLVPPNLDEQKELDRLAMFEIALEGGIGGLVQHTRDVENSDPDRSKHIRHKHSDDSTGILIERVAA